MTTRASGVELLGLGATLAVAIAAATFLALSSLGRPARFDSRTAALESELSETQDLSRGARNRGGYAPKALCRGSVDQAALDLRRQLQLQGTAASVALSDVVVSPATSGNETGLTPVTLHFQASGRYEAVIGLMGALAQSKPQIFVDTLDLVPDVANTRLSVTGRALCLTYARP